MKNLYRSFALALFCITVNITDTQAQIDSITVNPYNTCSDGCYGGASVTIHGGTPPFSYTWNTTPVQTGTYVYGLCAGAYSVTVTDTTGSSLSKSFTIEEFLEIISSISKTDDDCGCTGTATVTASGGVPPYYYLWSNGATSSGISNLCAGNYSVAVYDTNGCVKYDSVLINNTSGFAVTLLSKTDATCSSACDGSTSVTASGGTSPYTYLWSPGGQTSPSLNNLCTGNYNVIVTDASNCQNNLSITIGNASNLDVNATATNITCFNGNDGSLIATASGGTSPYTYSWAGPNGWTSTSSNIANLYAGPYNIIVTDVNGCSTSKGFTVTSPQALSFKFSSTPATCSNADGTASVNTVTGGTSPYTFLWSNGQTTLTATGLKAGYRTLSVTDSKGCTKTDSVFIGNNSSITLSFTTVAAACADGSATVTASNGTAPYSYYWNTNPVQTNATANNLTAGSYLVVVTDETGCTKQGAVTVAQGISPLVVSISTVNETCLDSNGTATVTSVTGGTAPYTYAWSNGQTTQTATGFVRGNYFVIIKDATNCELKRTFVIERSVPLSAGFTGTNPSACNAADGSLTVNVSGGTAPYTYKWGNGATTQTASGLTRGWHGVTVTDANGCSKNFWNSVWVTCESYISGYVYEDLNNNCIKDAGEKGLYGALIMATSTTGIIRYDYTWTDGYYRIWVQPGDYVVSQTPPVYGKQYWNQTCPSAPGTYTISLPASGTGSANNNFGDVKIPDKHDLKINAWGNPCPGFSRNYWLYAYNEGTVTKDATVTFKLDSGVTYLSSNPTATSFNASTNTATWDINNFEYNSIKYIYVEAYTPLTFTNSDVLKGSIIIDPVTGDPTPADNKKDPYHQYMSCAYDPNNILVTPRGDGADGNILPTDTILDYQVNFQNTGNDTAHTVVIKDTLDPNHDIATLIPGMSSHPYELTVEGNVLTFTFDDIMLPDSNINEPGSHGMVTYKVHLKKNLPLGTQIKNTAGIIFDFNEAVITNTALNTIANPDAVEEIISSNGSVKVYPNPFSNTATFVLDSPLGRGQGWVVSLYNLLGKEVKTISSTTSQCIINRDDLSQGIYIYKVSTVDGIIGQGKLIIR